MKAKIARVILWPKKDGVEPAYRSVDFKMKGIEVVTGGSQRGKSALISIIDYCLGSDECRIPIGLIRNSAGWFGTELHFEGKRRLLLCRRNPENQGGTDEMRIAEGERISADTIPDTPISRSEVINVLNQRAGLPEIGVSPDSDPPSFRDMVAFNFQPQHVIANPTSLFYFSNVHKTDRVEEVFPLVLGAESVEAIALKIECGCCGLRGKKCKRNSIPLLLDRGFGCQSLRRTFWTFSGWAISRRGLNLMIAGRSPLW